MNADAFKQQPAADGFEVREVELPKNTVNERHSHLLYARVMLMEGAVSIETDDGVKNCAGDVAEMAAGCMHTERVGAEGAKLLVGVKAAHDFHRPASQP